MRANKHPDEKFEWDYWTVLVIVLAIVLIAMLTMELWLPHR
jgi:hypothetical protein